MFEDSIQPDPELPNDPQPESHSRFSVFVKLFLWVSFIILIGVVFLSWILFQLNQPPATFPTNEPVVIEPGTSVMKIAEQLKAQGVVQSEQLLYYILVFLHEPSSLKASTYVFDAPIDSLAVARRLTEGDFDTDLIRFTHIEGERASMMAKRADSLLPNFDVEYFIATTSQLEGKLYPETYFVPVTYTTEELITLMLETYQETIAPLEAQITASALSENEVLILASILEREANSPESMRIVSGILQNRLAIDMPLQADATIEYVLDTPLGELPPGTLANELRDLDSPYNTYLYTGLPPTAIGNPGLDAITAVLNPTESDYFYYITGNDGEFYYAETYDQHRQNISRYLR